jgi:hypothetical protein
MSHPERLKKVPIPGVQGSPCQGLGASHYLPGGEGLPAEGSCSLHSRLQKRFEEHNRFLNNSG